jgi:Recombinase.
MPPLAYAGLIQAHKGPYSGLWSAAQLSDKPISEYGTGEIKKSATNPTNASRDRKDWIVVEKTHESLVERDVFERVQLLIASRKKTRRRAPSNKNNRIAP